MLKDLTLNKPDNQKWLKGVGLFQIIGGVIGIIIIAISLTTQPTSLLTFLTSFSIFAFSIFAGWQAYILKENSLKWTTINQSLQIFSVIIGHFGYLYVSGVCIDATFDFSNGVNLGMSFKLSHFSFEITGNKKQYFVGINLIAVYIIYKIEKIKTEVMTNKELQESLKNHKPITS